MPENNSQETGRTLADIVGGVQILEGSCGWPLGDSVIAELRAKLMPSACFRVIDDLVAHVETMGIASRYRRDRYPQQSYDEAQPTHVPSHIISGSTLNNAGHQRRILLAGLENVRFQIYSAFSTLEHLRLVVEATNMNDDGTHVPALPEEKRREDDLLKR